MTQIGTPCIYPSASSCSHGSQQCSWHQRFSRVGDTLKRQTFSLSACCFWNYIAASCLSVRSAIEQCFPARCCYDSFTSFSLVSLLLFFHICHAVFNASNIMKIMFAIVNEGIRPNIPEDCPAGLAQLIRECWNEDPELRLLSIQIYMSIFVLLISSRVISHLSTHACIMCESLCVWLCVNVSCLCVQKSERASERERERARERERKREREKERAQWRKRLYVIVMMWCMGVP